MQAGEPPGALKKAAARRGGKGLPPAVAPEVQKLPLPPGQLGKFDQANYLTLKHSDDEFTFYGHVRKGSAAVKIGDKVAKGQAIARVGNSGASGTPHLHFTMLMPIKGGWLSVPWRLQGFTLVEAGGTSCSVDAKQARPQEGWVLVTK